MSKLTPFASRLAAFGLPLRAVPELDPEHPPPTGGRAVLHLHVPDNQIARLLEADGWDPSAAEGKPTPPGGAARRLLHDLLQAGAIQAWHCFQGEDAVWWCHILLSDEQAVDWYTAIDWSSKTVASGQGRPEHTFA